MTEIIQYIFLIIIAFSVLYLMLWSSRTVSGTEGFTNNGPRGGEKYARVNKTGDWDWNLWDPSSYIPYYPYREQIWNNPTRIRSYYWPYLYYDPTYYPWYYRYPVWQ
jgi:hypothetical protein